VDFVLFDPDEGYMEREKSGCLDETCEASSDKFTNIIFVIAINRYTVAIS
jgi:hypothetical protein